MYFLKLLVPTGLAFVGLAQARAVAVNALGARAGDILSAGGNAVPLDSRDIDGSKLTKRQRHLDDCHDPNAIDQDGYCQKKRGWIGRDVLTARPEALLLDNRDIDGSAAELTKRQRHLDDCHGLRHSNEAGGQRCLSKRSRIARDVLTAAEEALLLENRDIDGSVAELSKRQSRVILSGAEEALTTAKEALLLDNRSTDGSAVELAERQRDGDGRRDSNAIDLDGYRQKKRSLTDRDVLTAAEEALLLDSRDVDGSVAEPTEKRQFHGLCHGRCPSRNEDIVV